VWGWVWVWVRVCMLVRVWLLMEGWGS